MDGKLLIVLGFLNEEVDTLMKVGIENSTVIQSLDGVSSFVNKRNVMINETIVIGERTLLCLTIVNSTWTYIKICYIPSNIVRFGNKGCTKIFSFVSLKQIYNIFVYNIYIMIFIHFINLFHTFSRKSQTLGTTIKKAIMYH